VGPPRGDNAFQTANARASWGLGIHTTFVTWRGHAIESVLRCSYPTRDKLPMRGHSHEARKAAVPPPWRNVNWAENRGRTGSDRGRAKAALGSTAMYGPN